MTTVDVTIPVDEAAAQALATPEQRERIGRLVTQMLNANGRGELIAFMLDRVAQGAAERGLTDEEVDAELAAHKAERKR